MDFSDRQEEIIHIVKEREPISADNIAQTLGLSKSTIRSDLAVLTVSGVLEAKPKVGYHYSGLDFNPLASKELYETKVAEIMSVPIIIPAKTSVKDAITSLFMYDTSSLFVAEENTQLQGVISRKDLLRSLLAPDQEDLPIGVMMTRMPNIIVVTPEMTVLEAAQLISRHQVDSLPVVDKSADYAILGKISKTNIVDHYVSIASKRN